MTPRTPLTTGELGCVFKLPAGRRIKADDGQVMDRLDLLDENDNVSWSIRFFDNLHMDLRNSMRSHLKKDIETYVVELVRTYELVTSKIIPLTCVFVLFRITARQRPFLRKNSGRTSIKTQPA